MRQARPSPEWLTRLDADGCEPIRESGADVGGYDRRRSGSPVFACEAFGFYLGKK